MMMSEELEAILRAQFDGGYDTAREAEQLQSAIDRLASDPLARQHISGIVDAAVEARTENAHWTRSLTRAAAFLKALVPHPRARRTAHLATGFRFLAWGMLARGHRGGFPVALAALFTVMGGAVVALALVGRSHGLEYWVSAASLLGPLAFFATGKVLQPASSRASDQLDEATRQLARSVLRQWRAEAADRIPLYQLPVRFSPEVSVMDSWATISRGPAPEPPRLEGTFDSVASVFRAEGMPGRLVVLGEAGSGKSTLAASLTRALLIEPEARSGLTATAGPAGPVPVMLALAAWNPGSVALQDWAAAEIARANPRLGTETLGRGGTARTLAARLLSQRRILMVLDGLDEIQEVDRRAAFRQLCHAAQEGQALVVTCRTREYARIVSDSGHPMPETPVIRLHPVPPTDASAYLAAAGRRSGGRAGELAALLDAAPHGPLAEALQSPLCLSLATSVYQDRRDPAELARYSSRDEVLQHLLYELIPALYSAPAHGYPPVSGPAAVAAARRWLTWLAGWLGPGVQSQDIDWWQLPRQVPGWFTGGLIGTLVGCVLGAASGLAAAARFSSGTSVLLGVIVGIVAGALGGITAARPPGHPLAVEFRFKWDYWRFAGCLAAGAAVGLTIDYADHLGGGLIAGLITAVVVGVACALPAIRAAGRAPGIFAGFAVSVMVGLAGGLSAGNSHPVWSGLAAGLVFMIGAWVFTGLFQLAPARLAGSPQVLLDRDRIGALAVAGIAGVTSGVVYGIALGPLFAVVAGAALAVAVALTVSEWGAFTAARIWLALSGALPLRAMSFLNEAYARGVLREVGASYQFRHIQLKEALLARAADGKNIPPVTGGGPGASTLGNRADAV
jgi:hypothetical protein